MSKSRFFWLAGIIILLVAGCKFLTESDSNRKETTNGSTLIGKAVYIDTTDSKQGAVGTRVGGYQNDQEIVHTIITSMEGDFILTMLQSGLYDIVFTTDQNYQATKFSDVIISSGHNTLTDTIKMFYPKTIFLDDYIVVRFKELTTKEEREKIITESNCTVEYYCQEMNFYVLIIPPNKSEIKTVEWFLKKTKVLWADMRPIMPLDNP